METINKISNTRIEIVKTIKEKQEFEKATLEAMKLDLENRLIRINELLKNFK